MYAVVEFGGHQYRVEEGQQIDVDRVDGSVGDELNLESVLLLQAEDEIKAGQPLVEGASVKARIVAHGQGDKVITFKYRPRRRYRKRRGFRASFTTLAITSIHA